MPRSSVYREEAIKVLAKFFLENFAEDASGVADWLIANDIDTDQFYDQVQKINGDK